MQFGEHRAVGLCTFGNIELRDYVVWGTQSCGTLQFREHRAVGLCSFGNTELQAFAVWEHRAVGLCSLGSRAVGLAVWGRKSCETLQFRQLRAVGICSLGSSKLWDFAVWGTYGCGTLLFGNIELWDFAVWGAQGCRNIEPTSCFPSRPVLLIFFRRAVSSLPSPFSEDDCVSDKFCVCFSDGGAAVLRV